MHVTRKFCSWLKNLTLQRAKPPPLSKSLIMHCCLYMFSSATNHGIESCVTNHVESVWICMNKYYIEFSSLQFRFFTKVPNPLKAHPRNGKLENSASAATCGSCKGLSTEPAPHLCNPVPNSFRPFPVVHIVCSNIESMGDWHFDWHSAAQGPSASCCTLSSLKKIEKACSCSFVIASKWEPAMRMKHPPSKSLKVSMHVNMSEC